MPRHNLSCLSLLAAQTHLQECFQLMETMGDLRGQADVSAGLGYLALQRGEVKTAVSRLQNSLHGYTELIPQTVVQSTLSPAEYETAVAIGQKIPLIELLTQAVV